MPRANGQGEHWAGALASPLCAFLSSPLGASKALSAADLSALPSENHFTMRRGSESRERGVRWRVAPSGEPETERLEGTFQAPRSLYERGQFRAPVSSQTISLGVPSAKSSPYRGRITGPVKFINQLLDAWHLNTEAACTLLGFEPSDSAYIDGVLRGYATLRGRDAKDRIAYLFNIRKSLAALFRDQSVENEWLREPQDILNGETPMNLMLEGSMENLLLLKEYVELVAGR